jgi:diadenosine tetraphosphate (Ap4A) HIT family hydrolase
MTVMFFATTARNRDTSPVTVRPQNSHPPKDTFAESATLRVTLYPTALKSTGTEHREVLASFLLAMVEFLLFEVPRREPAPCWFCLSNPKLEKHLLIAIGDEFYLTVPKGSVDNYHALIVPINHYVDLRAVPEECKESVTEELEKFVEAISKLYDTLDMEPLLFEVSRPQAKSQHFHIQVITS